MKPKGKKGRNGLGLQWASTGKGAVEMLGGYSVDCIKQYLPTHLKEGRFVARQMCSLEFVIAADNNASGSLFEKLCSCKLRMKIWQEQWGLSCEDHAVQGRTQLPWYMWLSTAIQ